MAGHSEGVMETGLRLALVLEACQQQLAFEPIQLRLVAPLPSAVHERKRLVQHLPPFVALAVLPLCPG